MPMLSDSEPRREPPADPTKESIDGFACGPDGCHILQELPPDQIDQIVTATEEILAKRKAKPQEEPNT